jgi:2-polyprenyl-3-methyl-5-hydroxy-6-metoxy-1,4-benzoquinol methylase
MTYKEITRESYQSTAEEFARNVLELAPTESIQRFYHMLPSDGKILDMGCGSGRDAKIFTEMGLSVLGVDISSNLLGIAKQHAPLAEFQIMDIENLSFPPSTFHGIWAACSLSHVPKKLFPHVLGKIHLMLKHNGYFYLTLRQGVGEFLEKDLRYGNFEKFWSFFEEQEIQDLMQSSHFEVLECKSVYKKAKYQTFRCVRLFCQKK